MPSELPEGRVRPEQAKNSARAEIPYQERLVASVISMNAAWILDPLASNEEKKTRSDQLSVFRQLAKTAAADYLQFLVRFQYGEEGTEVLPESQTFSLVPPEMKKKLESIQKATQKAKADAADRLMKQENNYKYRDTYGTGSNRFRSSKRYSPYPGGFNNKTSNLRVTVSQNVLVFTVLILHRHRYRAGQFQANQAYRLTISIQMGVYTAQGNPILEGFQSVRKLLSARRGNCPIPVVNMVPGPSSLHSTTPGYQTGFQRRPGTQEKQQMWTLQSIWPLVRG